MKHIATIVVAAALASAPAHASEEGWDDAGSLARDALVVAAFGVPLVQEDWNGALQAGGSIAATIVVTTGLKEAIPSRRPDGSDNKSFPSGHTSVSFAAAATLHKRRGWQVGVPAYLVATFVGVSRVEARKHRVGDVMVGAAIGTAAGHLITNRANDRVQIVPWGSSSSAGATLSMRF